MKVIVSASGAVQDISHVHVNNRRSPVTPGSCGEPRGCPGNSGEAQNPAARTGRGGRRLLLLMSGPAADAAAAEKRSPHVFSGGGKAAIQT